MASSLIIKCHQNKSFWWLRNCKRWQLLKIESILFKITTYYLKNSSHIIKFWNRVFWTQITSFVAIEEYDRSNTSNWSSEKQPVVNGENNYVTQSKPLKATYKQHTNFSDFQKVIIHFQYTFFSFIHSFDDCVQNVTLEISERSTSRAI